MAAIPSSCLEAAIPESPQPWALHACLMQSQAGDPQKPVIFLGDRADEMMEKQAGTETAAFWPLSAILKGNFADFLGFQADSPHAFSTLVEDQSVQIVGQVAKGEFRFGAG